MRERGSSLNNCACGEHNNMAATCAQAGVRSPPRTARKLPPPAVAHALGAQCPCRCAHAPARSVTTKNLSFLQSYLSTHAYAERMQLGLDGMRPQFMPHARLPPCKRPRVYCRLDGVRQRGCKGRADNCCSTVDAHRAAFFCPRHESCTEMTATAHCRRRRHHHRRGATIASALS